MQKRFIPAVVLPLLVSTFVCSADETVAPIIVTATRTAQTADQTLASVTVITRAEIEQEQAQSVEDVLRGVPGLSLSNSGGPGKATSVFLRGADSDHVLVLIDGVKVGSATLGTTAFEELPVDQIERIEIVRGPRSSLYGSEAIGGVIQIFTRKGGGPTTPYFSVGAGSYRTYNTSAGVSGGGTHSWYNFSASDDHTSGIVACNDPAGCYAAQTNKDGYRNTSGTLRAGYRFDNGAEVDFHALRAQGSTEYDGDPDLTQFVQQVIGSTVHFAPIEPWNVSIAVGHSNDDADNIGQLYGSVINTARDTFSWQNDFTLAANQLLTVGLDYQDDHIDSTEAYAVTSRDNKGLFTQYQGTFGTEDVQLALRDDDNQQFGTHATGSLAWGHGFTNGMRLMASYGTAFKAPSFNELYWPYSSDNYGGPTNYITQGNPTLAPESSRTGEIGLQHIAVGNAVLGFSAYDTWARDLIDWTSTDTGPNQNTTVPTNINQARIYGLETTIDATVADWKIKTSLTLQNPENQTAGSGNGNILPRRAQQMAHLDLDRQLGLYRIGATLFAQGRRFDDLANSERLGGYTTVDLRAEYAFSRDWTLAARVANLFNKSYETAAFYNQPGRNYFLTLRYQPANH